MKTQIFSVFKLETVSKKEKINDLEISAQRFSFLQQRHFPSGISIDKRRGKKKKKKEKRKTGFFSKI